MSRALLRSALELRTPITRLPPTFLLPIRARSIHNTSAIIEPTPTPASPTPDAASRAADILTSTPPPQAPPQAPPRRAPPPPPSPQQVAAAAAAAPPVPDSVRALLPHLAAQPGRYVTAHIHGRPYLVTAGDRVRLPFRMPGVVPGDVLRLNRASVLGSRDYTLKGAPYVDERLFECRAVVVGTETEPMRVKLKTKRRTRRVKHVRSKEKYTVLRVSELKVTPVADL